MSEQVNMVRYVEIRNISLDEKSLAEHAYVATVKQAMLLQ